MDYICTKCSYVGERKKVIGGSNLVSIMMWTVLPTLWEVFSSGSQMVEDPLVMLQKMQDVGSGGMVRDIILTSIPGIGYSIWRRVKKKYVCPQCNEKVMAPVLNRASKKIIGELADDLSPENLKKIPFRWQKDIEEYKAKQALGSKRIVDDFTAPNEEKNSSFIQGENSLPKEDSNKNDKENQW
jgi:hypothetical protein